MKKGVQIFIVVVSLVMVVVAVITVVNAINDRNERNKQEAIEAFREAGEGGINPDEYVQNVEQRLKEIEEGSQRIIDIHNGGGN